jgi:hypothetical protein
VPASKEQDENPYIDNLNPNPRSAEPNLQKSKAQNYHSIERVPIYDTRTP